MNIPERNTRLSKSPPRFIDDFVAISIPGGVMVDGGEHVRLVRSSETGLALPMLLAALDGTRTVAEVKEFFPDLSIRKLELAIERLAVSGLIEAGLDESETASSLAWNRDTVGFFRRFSNITARNTSGWAAYRSMASTRVIVLVRGGQEHWGSSLLSLLADTGLQDVRLLAPTYTSAKTIEAESPSSGSIVVALCCTGEDQDWSHAVDRWCLKNHLPWLRAVFDQNLGYADVGPLFEPSIAPCYRCFSEVHVPRADTQTRKGVPLNISHA